MSKHSLTSFGERTHILVPKPAAYAVARCFGGFLPMLVLVEHNGRVLGAFEAQDRNLFLEAQAAREHRVPFA